MPLLREPQTDNELKTEPDQNVHQINFSIKFRNIDINQIHGRVDQRTRTENSQKILF